MTNMRDNGSAGAHGFEAGKDAQASDPASGQDAAGTPMSVQGADAEAPVDSSTKGAKPAPGDATSVDAQADGESISDEELADLLNGVRAADGDTAASGAAGDEDAKGGTEDNPLAAEYLNDLKRVNAEYANYRIRTDREKAALTESTTAHVLKGFLPILDDLDRAEKHGDVTEGTPLASMVQKLRALVAKAGMTAFGEKGEPFDPNLHEAIAQLPGAPEHADEIADVVEVGYRIGDRLVRPAKVAVFHAA